MSERKYSKGGFIPGPTVTVKARKVGERVEYWEPSIGVWIPVFTAEELRHAQNEQCGTVDNTGEHL